MLEHELPEQSDVQRSSESFAHTIDIPNSLLEAARQAPHGAPDTFGATPLDRASTFQQQTELFFELQQLTYRDIPGDIPMEIADYVHSTFATRFYNRAEANEENYTTALRDKSVVARHAGAYEMIERAERGYATPAELLITRQLLGIRSVELACLTHPYGVKIKTYLNTMREAVRDNVRLLGGEYFESPQEQYRVKESLNEDKGQRTFKQGVLMTRKRTLATLPDGTLIKERSSFVLRLDTCEIVTDEDITKIQTVSTIRSDWGEEVARIGSLDIAAKLLLDADEFSLAVPISTTIYAYNPETTRLVRERQEEIKEERLHAFAKEAPFLVAAQRAASEQFGLYYSGPEFEDED